MKTVLVNSDPYFSNRPSGDIATFNDHFASLLRNAGFDMSILNIEFAPQPLDPLWQANNRARGIETLQITAPAPSSLRYPVVPAVTLSEAATGLLQMSDVVYSPDRENRAFDLLRRRRFSASSPQLPVCVTVLHGATLWLRDAERQFIDIPQDLNRDYIEMYATQFSDMIVSPGQYMVDWAKAHGWILPSAVRTVGLPFVPEHREETAPGTAFTQLVFYGSLEPRKGLDLFTNAVKMLSTQSPPAYKRIEKIVFLGHYGAIDPADSQQLTPEEAQDALRKSGIAVELLTNLDNRASQNWLAAHASTALVVAPSTGDNFPYNVIEASLIPGLNLLCAATGDIPAILGDHDSRQLFAPQPRPLAATLADWLERGPLPASALAHYDFEAANERWLALHQEACALADKRTPSAHLPMPADGLEPRVDVCVAHYNHAKYLPQLLESLAHQTVQNFRVIVVDDGSTEPNAETVFQKIAAKYPRWTFIRQENKFVDAARNRAAREGTAPYIVFLDADDVAALTLVEHFLQAIEYSGDDSLVCMSYRFAGDEFPYDLTTGRITAEAIGLHAPLGVNLASAAADPNILGGTAMIIRRPVFEALKGFTEVRGVGHEDWELHVRVKMAGYKTDVLPEFLYFYRNLETGLSRSTDRVADKMRLLRPYEAVLEQIGLGGMAIAFQGMYQEAEALKRSISQLEATSEGDVNRGLSHQQNLDTASAAELSANLEERLWKLEHKFDTRLWEVEHRLETRLWNLEKRKTFRSFLGGLLPAPLRPMLNKILRR